MRSGWKVCIAEKCEVSIPPGHYFCELHWPHVPRVLRRLLWRRSGFKRGYLITREGLRMLELARVLAGQSYEVYTRDPQDQRPAPRV